MKTNIRLFVPNTTEALDFEYGLLIHYMKYNEYRSQAEIGLKYYELADIDPINNALDIVQQQVITDATRGQSKIDGFTLDSHYTLSFNQRLNNKIEENSARQIWLWLNCNNPKEYHFLLEKITDTEQKIVSDQNQLFVRLWRHPEWMEHDIDPFDQGKIGSLLELISVVKQRLEAQFDQIEQENRQKVLAEFNIKKIPTTPVATVATEASITEYKPKPIICETSSQSQDATKQAIVENKITDSKLGLAQLYAESERSLGEKMLFILESYSAVNYHTKGNIPLEKLDNARASYPVDQNDVALALIDSTIFGSAKTGMVIGLKGVYFRNNWMTETLENFLSWGELNSNRSLIKDSSTGCIKLMDGCDFNISVSDLSKNQIIEMLDRLLDLFNEHYFTSISSNDESTSSVKSKILSEPEDPVYVATQNNIPEPIEQTKKSTWWIWPLIIFIGFLFNPIAGGVLIALAICWYILKFIFSSPILCLILVVIIIFGFLSVT